MPHVVIEYSDNLLDLVSDAELTKKAHAVVTESGLFDPQAVKARAILYKNYILPEGAANFLHITVSILSGRSELEKKSLSENIFNMVKREIEGVDRLSVDIHDMDIKSYSK